ncbi:MAG: SDR family oxidoreductase [Thermoguttaceae bacterium]|nr:SDR family oxidoreductase [Thermoguttaceae bacterium]
MRRLLITGASGFVGGNLAIRAAERWQAFATLHAAAATADGVTAVGGIDVSQSSDVDRAVDEVHPDAIIHAAAMANLDSAAADPQRARQVNVEGTRNVARAAARTGARLVYLSTDLVFDGEHAPYREDIEPKPILTYGRSKLEGERAALEIAPCCVVRSALLFGWSRTAAACFTEVMLRRLREGHRVKLFTDEFRTPLAVDTLCEILLELAERRELAGVYHAAGTERLSRYEFGRRTCVAFGLPVELLDQSTRDQVPSREPRPRDCSLDTTKLRAAIRTPIPSVEESLERMRRQRD